MKLNRIIQQDLQLLLDRRFLLCLNGSLFIADSVKEHDDQYGHTQKHETGEVVPEEKDDFPPH